MQGANSENPWQQNSLATIMAGRYDVSPQTNQYLGAVTRVGANAFAGSNPALQGMIDKSNSDITNDYQKS